MPIANLNRCIISLSGDGVSEWLENLITNNLSSNISFSALLTPQGKIISDFFITKSHEKLIIDAPKKNKEVLINRLNIYKLRAPVIIEDITERMNVYALWDIKNSPGLTDPRKMALGTRLLTTDYLETEGDYDTHRLSLGIVDSEWDFETGTTFPANSNMDLMNGVDFKKGCFVGQEVVSRMKRMTDVKKRMRSVELTKEAKAGDKIICEGRVVGNLVHVNKNYAMAVIRFDRLRNSKKLITVNNNKINILGRYFE
jgi:folate-binding protein YgfZ